MCILSQLLLWLKCITIIPRSCLIHQVCMCTLLLPERLIDVLTIRNLRSIIIQSLTCLRIDVRTICNILKHFIQSSNCKCKFNTLRCYRKLLCIIQFIQREELPILCICVNSHEGVILVIFLYSQIKWSICYFLAIYLHGSIGNLDS